MPLPDQGEAERAYIRAYNSQLIDGRMSTRKVFIQGFRTAEAALLPVLRGVTAAAEEEGAQVCMEFCTHSTDPPEDCPMADTRVAAARATLDGLEAPGV